jgi:diguanylate cyclase (GGDEF)-like protein
MQDNSSNTNALKSNALLACLQIGKILTSTLNLNEILELIMSKVSQLIEAQNWSLFLIDERTNELTFEVVVGIDKELIKNMRIPIGQGIAGIVAQTGEPLFIADAQNDPRLNRKVDQITGFTTESIICIPLKIHGTILGVIEVINIDDIEYFKSTYLPILEILTDYAAVAIMNSKYFSKIQHMNITDEYTGLFNARYLHEVLAQLVTDYQQKIKSIAVIFMDVDNFKNVVDSYGHLSGSKVLKEIGQTITDCLGDRDILFKYGGDEYVIILPHCNKQNALKLAEEIRQAISNSTYLRSETKGIKVTASFGLAMYPQDAKTEKELLIKADNFMYCIKKTSKNGIGAA